MHTDTSAIEAVIKLELGRRRARGTIQRYIQATRRYCRFARKTYGFTRQDYLRYFDYLIDRGFAPRTLIWTYSALMKMAQCIGEGYPITIEDLPRHTSYRKTAAELAELMLSHGKVYSLVTNIRRKGTPAEQFYLAMSTIYGLRRVELAELSASSFDSTLSTVTVQAAKGGEMRTHHVPQEIKPSIRLAINTKSIGYAPGTLSLMFINMCQKASVRRGDGVGWHSIRRALNTYLLRDQVPYHVVRDFLRWKASSKDMPGLYFHLESHEVDQIIFEKHPFLEMWR